MKTRIFRQSLIVALCALCLAVPALAQTKPQWSPDDARCLIRIDNFFMMTSTHRDIVNATNALHALVNSPLIKQEQELYTTEIIVRAEGTDGLFSINIPSDGSGKNYGVRTEYLRRILKRLQDALNQEFQNHQKQKQEEITLANRRLDQIEGTLRELQRREKELLDKAGVSQLSRDSVQNRITDLKQKEDKLKMELVGIKARREALTKEIAKTGQELNQQQEKEPVYMVVQSYLSRLDNYSPDERDKIRLEIFKLTEKYLQIRSDETSSKWNNELAELSIREAELEAQQKYVAEQLAREKGLLDLAYRYEIEVASKIDPAREAYAQTQKEDIQLHQQFRAAPPTVTLLGDVPEEKPDTTGQSKPEN